MSEKQRGLDLGKAWTIGMTNLLRMSRDRSGLITTLLMPMVLIAVLGAALSGMFKGGSIPPFNVVVMNQDQPAKPKMPELGAFSLFVPSLHFGKILSEDVFGSEDVKAIINVKRAASAADGRKLVADGQAVAMVLVPRDFSAKVLSGQNAQVQVVSDPGQQTLSGIVRQVVTGFTDSLATGMAAGELLGVSSAQALAEDARSWTPSVHQVSSGTRDISALQYYAAAMSLMFLTMTALSRGSNILRERETGTLLRTLASPTSPSTVIMGHAIGTVSILILQFSILMAGTRLLYGVAWGIGGVGWMASWGLGLAFACAVTGLSLALASIFKDVDASQGSIGLIGNITAVLSGGMFPLYGFPPIMRTVAKAIPNYWGLKGFLDQMGGMGASVAVLPIASLLILGIILASFGSTRLAKVGA